MGICTRLFCVSALSSGIGVLGLAACSDGSFGGKNAALRGGARGPAVAATPGGLVFRNDPNLPPSLKEMPPADIAGMNLVADCSPLPDDLPGDNKGKLACFLERKDSGERVKGFYDVKAVTAVAADGSKLTTSHTFSAEADGTMRINVTVLMNELANLASVGVVPAAHGKPPAVEPWSVTAGTTEQNGVLHDMYKGDYFDLAYDTELCNKEAPHFALDVDASGNAFCPDDAMMVVFSEDYRPAARMAERPPSIACCRLKYEKLLWKPDHSARGESSSIASGKCPAGKVATGIVSYFSDKKLRCTETDGRIRFKVPAATIIVPAAATAPFMSQMLSLMVQVLAPIVGAFADDDKPGAASSTDYASITNMMTKFSGRTALGCRMRSSIVGWMPANMTLMAVGGQIVSGILGSVVGSSPGSDRPFPPDIETAMIPICGAYERALGENYPYWNFGGP